MEDARKFHPEQVSSSVPKEEEQTDVKNSNSLPVLGLAVENSLSMVVKMKKIVVGTDAFVIFIAYIDMLILRSSAGSRKKVLQEQLLF